MLEYADKIFANNDVEWDQHAHITFFKFPISLTNGSYSRESIKELELNIRADNQKYEIFSQYYKKIDCWRRSLQIAIKLMV